MTPPYSDLDMRRVLLKALEKIFHGSVCTSECRDVAGEALETYILIILENSPETITRRNASAGQFAGRRLEVSDDV